MCSAAIFRVGAAKNVVGSIALLANTVTPVQRKWTFVQRNLQRNLQFKLQRIAQVPGAIE
jgi:hypothetical protein